MICKNIFTTIEKAELSGSVLVANKSGMLTPFSRDKLFISVLKACGHRPSAMDDAGGITDTVVALLRPKMALVQLSSKDIVKTAQNVLERFDKAAAVQYSAYHKA